MSPDQILAILAASNGAILCWQVNDPSAFWDAVRDGIINFDADSDLFVHPEAIDDNGGYHMPSCND